MTRHQLGALLVVAGLIMGLVGCEGTIGGDDDEVILTTSSSSLKAATAARKTILETRPQATAVFAKHILNVLKLSGVNVPEQSALEQLEKDMSAPLTDGKAPTTCPYLAPRTGSRLSCRYLTELAAQWAATEISTMKARVTQSVRSSYSTQLTGDEVSYVDGWGKEAVASGIESGSAHATAILRRERLCDQDLAPSERAFQHGEAQGMAILEQTESRVLPTIPKTLCQTDVIAETVFAEAKTAAESFIEKNPLCADSAGSVDLDQARLEHRAGVEEGLRQAKEALRVRLVSTWTCTPATNTATPPTTTGTPPATTPPPTTNTPPQTTTPTTCTCVRRMNGMGVIQCVAGTHSAEEIKKASWLTSPDSSTLTAPVQSSRGGVVLTFVPKSSCDTAPVPVGSPLVLDLDGDGIRLSDERVRFDLAATGEMAKIPALQGADAFLALDLDGNGRIDSGVELFGNATSCGARRCSDGIEALEQHDANHDGAINAADAVHANLRIWRDDNRDGRSEAGELTSLAEAGIRSISLAARLDLSFVDARGNAATRSLVFERSTGARGVMPDVWFSLEFDRLPSDPRSSGIVTTAAAR